MTRPAADDPRRYVVSVTEGTASLCRLVLVLRLAASVMLVAAAVLIDPRPGPLAAGSAVAVLVTGAELLALTRSPGVVARAGWFVLVELVAGAAVVAVMRGGPVFFSFSAGSAAVFGVVLGLRAVPLWVLQTAAAYAVVAYVIRAGGVPPDAAVYFTGVPTLYVLIGLAAAMARAAVGRHVGLAREALAAIERSAVAGERGRVARELHDSVEKTLRGLSFAALALPQSLRRRPELADELANTVARGAHTAAQEARELLDALRADDVVVPIEVAVRQLCEAWTARTGIPVQLDAAPVEVALEVRHEVLRIAREALGNVARHAGASRVRVLLDADRGELRLVVQDDGAGLPVPADLRTQADLAGLAERGHYGLVGMAERAAAVGGRFTAHSRPGAGFRVVLRAPLEPHRIAR